ncbi:hypothetical protein HUT18_09685 [Streptomyces sp. NA04227]|uniref:hypothetical protein n=1 Tax=Streptomyces sp. NA04227 TaxID=2742136 RepID=UPI00158FC482|nr:hypothetical protein [Streptomyces sp. NA04227]QKW06632.1 hypothetical protein HUT18_09685 [Streptomyces sp. NA04227]
MSDNEQATSAKSAKEAEKQPIDLSFFQSPTSQRKRAAGCMEYYIKKVLEFSEIEPTPAEWERLHNCWDLAVLGTWFERSMQASTSADIFDEECPTPRRSAIS